MTHLDEFGNESEQISTHTDEGDDTGQITAEAIGDADEITHTVPERPALAMIEGMVEGGQVTVDGVGFPLPDAILVVASQHPLDTSSRADLQREYQWRYAVLQHLPADFPDDGQRLQTRLEHGWTRSVVVKVGPALNGGGSLYDGTPWALVHFEVADTDGIDEELLPIDILKFLSYEERADPEAVTAGQLLAGQMSEMPAFQDDSR